MATGGFLSQIAAVIALIVAAVVILFVVRALWAEIGPMVRLLFRRGAHAARETDDHI